MMMYDTELYCVVRLVLSTALCVASFVLHQQQASELYHASARGCEWSFVRVGSS